MRAGHVHNAEQLLRPLLRCFLRLVAVGFAAVNYDRYVVVTMETVSATGLAGQIGLTLTSRPELGSQFDGNA